MSDKKQLNKDGFPKGESVNEKDYWAHVNKPKKKESSSKTTISLLSGSDKAN